MNKFAINGPCERRRRLLCAAAGAAIAPALSRYASANSSDALHTMVAADAKDLARGQVSTLRLLLPQGSEANLKPVIQAFEQMTGIAIVVSSTPVDEINTELLLDSMSNEGLYDVALPATFGLPDLAKQQAIIPLTAFAERYEPVGFRDDILFGLGDSYDNELYGFQADGDAYMMFYHRDLLENSEEQARYADQFGHALAIPTTWTELDRQMAYFHRPEEGLAGGLLFRTPGYLAWEWWVRFHAKGYWPLSPDMVPQIDSDAGVEALEDMIRASEHLLPETRSLGLFDNWKRFGNGGVYCNIGWGGTQKYLNSSRSGMQNRLVHGPTPGGMVDDHLLVTPYFNWGWNYVVTANTTHPEIAYLFALFASTPAMSTAAVREVDGFFDPYRPEHYQDKGIQAAYSTEFLSVHERSLRMAIPDLYLAAQSQYFQTLSDWLDRAIAGKVTPEVALNSTAQRWEIITRRQGRASQSQRWKRLRKQYPADAQRLLRDSA